MANKVHDLLASEFNWKNDWVGYSVYDVVYDRKLADSTVFSGIVKKIRRSH